ncbi:MAG: hypothetical protein VX527_03810 [Planctomycetota bacterium]|nr:hypothetical protein [Planctomycetota bacterium]
MITTPVSSVMQTTPPSMSSMTPGFAATLGRVSEGSREERIHQAAEQLVATSLVQPILASLTKSPFREGPFAPGPVEERFTPLLHRHLSDRIVASSNFGLVQALTDQLTARTGSVEITA